MKAHRILAIIIILGLVLAGCWPNQTGKKQEEDRNIEVVSKPREVDKSVLNTYDIHLDLDEASMTYQARQRVIYRNNMGKDLDRIYFHLYPNAFSSYEKAPILIKTWGGREEENYRPGYIEISKLEEAGRALSWSIEGEDDSILSLELSQALKEGEEREIYMEYKVQLPSSEDRFGYHNKGINAGNWYPILAVYDENGWNLDRYYDLGDPFYSEVANYKVSISLPKAYKLAGSGRLVSKKEDGDKVNYVFQEDLIRDFAWAASKEFLLEERRVEDTLISLYSIKNDRELMERALDVGEKSLRLFNKIFGKYPYDTLSIVNTEFPSGMEYPTFILISNDLFNKELAKSMETVIVHEIAHQWWYGLVGNNQIREAWLDEGLTTYSEVIFNREIYGEEAGKDYYNNNIKLGYDYSLHFLEGDLIVNKPLWEFEGWEDYGPLVYSRAAMFIKQIEEDFGQDKLYQILASYYEKYRFKVARTEDFIQVCQQVTGKSFKPLVKKYLNNKKQIR